MRKACRYGIIRQKTLPVRRLAPQSGAIFPPPDLWKGGDAVTITFSELIALGIFVIELIALIQSIKKKK